MWDMTLVTKQFCRRIPCIPVSGIFVQSLNVRNDITLAVGLYPIMASHTQQILGLSQERPEVGPVRDMTLITVPVKGCPVCRVNPDRFAVVMGVQVIQENVNSIW